MFVIGLTIIKDIIMVTCGPTCSNMISFHTTTVHEQLETCHVRAHDNLMASEQQHRCSHTNVLPAVHMCPIMPSSVRGTMCSKVKHDCIGQLLCMLASL